MERGEVGAALGAGDLPSRRDSNPAISSRRGTGPGSGRAVGGGYGAAPFPSADDMRFPPVKTPSDAVSRWRSGPADLPRGTIGLWSVWFRYARRPRRPFWSRDLGWV